MGRIYDCNQQTNGIPGSRFRILDEHGEIVPGCYRVRMECESSEGMAWVYRYLLYPDGSAIRGPDKKPLETADRRWVKVVLKSEHESQPSHSFIVSA
jgi:hypothetical protein